MQVVLTCERNQVKIRSTGRLRDHDCVASRVIRTCAFGPLFSEFCSEAICLPILHSASLRPTMFQQLDYQEFYRMTAHESVINAMVLSPDGRRLITGSGDSTILMWSTKTGSTLCRIKTHSPVLSLAWLKNSNGFLFGCENGMMASVDISEVLTTCSEPFTSRSC